jgi:hypothetical protein
VYLSSFKYAQGRFLQAAIWRCLGGLLLELISAKIFIFCSRPNWFWSWCKFSYEKWRPGEKATLGTLLKDTGKLEGWVAK